MKVLFIGTECENYAVTLFAALLKQRGHEVYLVFDPQLFDNDEIRNNRLGRFFDIRKNNIKKIQMINPDLICFSIYTKDYLWALEMASLIKQVNDFPIIFGGIHCILSPDEVIKNDCVDIMCIGEGELALLELVDSMKTGQIDYTIKNLWFKTRNKEIIRNELRPLIKDLDSLPFPDKDILFKQKPVFKSGYIMNTGRGCPYSCTFCVSETLNRYYAERGLGKYVRQRSVKNIIEELLYAKNKYNFKTINFTDDVFTLNINWLKEFNKEYKNKVGIPFFCTANPGTIKDEELIILKEAGCRMMSFGVQSACEKTRINIINRLGSNKRIKEVSRMCHRLKIVFSFDHIFNIPGEGIDEQVEALNLYNESRPDIINVFWMTYFPKIKLINIALEQGILNGEDIEKINKGEMSTSRFMGLGNDYSFGNKNMYDVFAFIFTLLPLLPTWLINSIIKKRWYRSSISLPPSVRLVIKNITRLKIGRFIEVFFPIQLLIVNIIDNLKIKLFDCFNQILPSHKAGYIPAGNIDVNK